MQDVDDALFQTIEDTRDPSVIWNRLKRAGTIVDQGVIYASRKKLLTYPAFTKAKGNEVSSSERLGRVTSLINRIRSAVEDGRDVWGDIALITILEGLPEEYDAKKDSILNTKGRTVQDAHSILASEEARILADRAIRRDAISQAAAATCHHCGRVGHYKRQCWHRIRSREPTRRHGRCRKRARQDGVDEYESDMP